MPAELWMEGWAYNESDHWAEDAKCSGMEPAIFTYTEKDDPIAKGMSYRERTEFNMANFELAEEVCIECPVFFQCRDAATEEDRQWTVRAGEQPLRFKEEAEALKAPKARVCQRGHVVEDGGRCKACKYAALQRARARKRLTKSE